MGDKKKYVVVLAHADGWGALSANKVIKHLHDHYPDVGVHLIVSQATKNKEGHIATKLEDLKTPRELKETNLLDYFKRIDKIYDATSTTNSTELLTFNQLARRYCVDKKRTIRREAVPRVVKKLKLLLLRLSRSMGKDQRYCCR